MSRMEWNALSNKWFKSCISCLRVYESIGSTWDQGVISMREFFSPNNNKYDSLQGRCKECLSHIQRDRIPGLSRDEMLKAQDNKCFLCNEVFPNNNYYICMDHDIKTRHVRKLLCKRCNIRMAGVDDDVWLEHAIKYRDDFRSSHQVIKLGQGEASMMIQITYDSEVLGKGTFWIGHEDDIENIGNIPALRLAKLVIANREKHTNGMWTAKIYTGPKKST